MYVCQCVCGQYLTVVCPSIPPLPLRPSQSELKGTKAALRDLQVDQSAMRQQVREATDAWKTAEEQVRSSQHSQEMLQLEMDTLRKEKSILSKVGPVCVCLCVWCACMYVVRARVLREMSRYVAESITTDSGRFGHVGLCQLRTELMIQQLCTPVATDYVWICDWLKVTNKRLAKVGDK